MCCKQKTIKPLWLTTFSILMLALVVGSIGCSTKPQNETLAPEDKQEDDVQESDFVEFMLSMPSGNGTEVIVSGLKEDGINCRESPFSSLGTLRVYVDAEDFEQARKGALELIASEELSVRLKKEPEGIKWEVYEKGKKTGDVDLTR